MTAVVKYDANVRDRFLENGHELMSQSEGRIHHENQHVALHFITKETKQGKSEGFDSCDQPSNLTQIGFNSLIFQPVWPWNLMDDLKKLYGTSSTLHQALCIISNPSVNSNWSHCPETLNLGQNRWFFVPCDLEIWWMTSKNYRAPLLHYIKLCASIQNHQWIQTGITVKKCSIWVKICDFLSCVTLKFDAWPWKTTGHLSYVVSSFVHHFITIGVFKLMLQSQNTQFGSKSVIYCPVWPWNLTDDLEKQ